MKDSIAVARVRELRRGRLAELYVAAHRRYDETPVSSRTR